MTTEVAGSVMRLFAVAMFALVLATTGARADCFRDMGRQKAAAVGVSQQLAALQKQLGNAKCGVFGLRWTEAQKSGRLDKGMLIYNSRTGELIRAVYVANKLKAESWSGVTTAALRGDAANNGIDQKHHVPLENGTSMIVSDSSLQFMRKNGLTDFVRGKLLTAGKGEPAEEDEAEVAQSEAETDTVAAVPPDAEAEAAKSTTPSARLTSCLERISQLDGSPSAEAKASETACEEELQMAEGRQNLRKAKEARFSDLLEMHLTGRLSSCLLKIGKLGQTASEDAKASGEACEVELGSRLAKSNDEQIYAMLETERDHDERMALIWKIPNAAVRDRQLEREERRHQRELNYVESCVKEIIDLGSKPSDGAMDDWSTCQREKYAARSEARKRTDEIERRIISTRDARERRKLALEIPLKEMKQYWLNHIEREEQISAHSSAAALPPR